MHHVTARHNRGAVATTRHQLRRVMIRPHTLGELHAVHLDGRLSLGRPRTADATVRQEGGLVINPDEHPWHTPDRVTRPVKASCTTRAATAVGGEWSSHRVEGWSMPRLAATTNAWMSGKPTRTAVDRHAERSSSDADEDRTYCEDVDTLDVELGKVQSSIAACRRRARKPKPLPRCGQAQLSVDRGAGTTPPWSPNCLDGQPFR